MGYGSRALQLLQMYYEGRFPCLEEKVVETSQEIHTVSSEVSIPGQTPGFWDDLFLGLHLFQVASSRCWAL